MLTLPSTKKAAINMTGKAPASRNRQNTKGSALLSLAKTVTRTPYAPKPSWAATKAHHTRGVIFLPLKVSVQHVWTASWSAAVSCRESSTVGHLETDVLLRVKWGVVSQCKQELRVGRGGSMSRKNEFIITYYTSFMNFQIWSNGILFLSFSCIQELA